jgi:CTP synthase
MGGVMSSLGKGIASASIGALLKARGFSIKIKKLDPYINVDPGTMSPHKHGEVFVTEDGCETDLDLGHYERFTNINCCSENYLTTGKVYENVINKERRGDYLGSDVQVIPHITNEIKEFIKNGSNDVDFVISEIGGTVGDIEGFPYLEAIRQLILDFGKKNIICIHLSYLPYIKVAEELKTKPTQHSVKQVQSMGIQPDILLCRSEIPIPSDIKTKLAMFCNVKKENVISALDAESIYLVPNRYHNEGLDNQIIKHFAITENVTKTDTETKAMWKLLEKIIYEPTMKVRIALVVKYTKLRDAYISLTQAIQHGGFANDCKVETIWIDAENDSIEQNLKKVDGIIVPGGFSQRGIDGKIEAIKYARENNIPFLGICLGMQLAVIEACRNVAGLKTATSREFSNEGDIVIDFMENWEEQGVMEFRNQDCNKGGTMRLGSYSCKLLKNSLANKIYGTTEISERHRHRYEIALTRYGDIFKKAGIQFSGMSLDNRIPEILERQDHQFFIATQAHPEFKSYPLSPHPLFKSFIQAAITATSKN